MARTRDVFGRGAEFHGDGGLRNHVAGIDTNHMDAEHAVGLGIGQDLHEAIGGEIDLGAAIGAERKLADIVGDAGGFELFFGFSDGRDFRIGVDHIRDGIVVHMARLPDQMPGTLDA
jgi:hypothetical protein